MKKLFLLAEVFATTLLVSCDKEDKEWLQDTVGGAVDNVTDPSNYMKPVVENDQE